MQSAFALVLLAALAAVAVRAAPASQEEPSDELKIFKKPVPLGELKAYQRPVPVPGLDEGLEEGTWAPFEQQQGPSGALGWDWAAQGPWADVPVHQTEPLRHKREVCMWLGQKACALKCKFFGRGATQGRCTYGYCECFYPGSYPGLSG